MNRPDDLRACNSPANDDTKRTLKPRHLIMIAIGGSIGTGLFVGSGKAIAEGGPLGVERAVQRRLERINTSLENIPLAVLVVIIVMR